MPDNTPRWFDRMDAMPIRLNSGGKTIATLLAPLCVCILLVVAGDADAAVPTTAPLVEVRVTHVISDRFPVLSDAELATVLKTASEMIATGYQRDVRFVSAKPAARTSADFFG